MKRNQVSTLQDVLSRIDKGIDDLVVDATRENSGRVVLGYNNLLYRQIVKLIRIHLEHLNSFVSAYIKLFPNTKVSDSLIGELMLLKLGSSAAIELEIKRRYMKSRNVEIPNFPRFRQESLIEIYDYPEDDQSDINAVVTAACDFFGSAPKSDAWTGEYSEYFSQELKKFMLMESQEKELLDHFTSYVSDDDFGELISLHMLSRALSDLSSIYSIEDLPELDFRMMPLLSVSRGRVSVNLDKVKEIRGGLKPGHDLEIEL